MARAYNVIDADGHILEPLDLWDRYIDPGFRERRPRFVIDENGKHRVVPLSRFTYPLQRTRHAGNA